MLGKFFFELIFYDLIVLIILVGVVFGGLGVVVLIIKFKLWGYLWKEWFILVDYKKIGVMYFIVVFVMLLCGFFDVIMMCIQQVIVVGGFEGYLLLYYYDQIFIVYGVIMIFFVVMLLIIGLMNLVVLLQIGVCDVVFLFVNLFSFWLFVVGVVLIMLLLWIGEFVVIGWLVFLLLLGIEYSLSVGMDYYIWGLQVVGLGIMFSGINFFIIIFKMCILSMKLMQMLVFIWIVLVINVLIVVVFLVLIIILVLLILDCYLGMYFFINDGGGNVMLYINLIWIWGYLEVYILVLLVFGVFFEVIVIFLCKVLFGYKGMVYVIVCIGVLLFIVWLYYFFIMGLGVNVNVFFGIMMMIILILIGVKIFNWLFIMFCGCVYFIILVLWIIGFMVIFVIGGMIGVMLVILVIDFVLYNSLFLIVYFYNVIIGGVVFGMFVGIIYWWLKMFGFCFNEFWGKCVFWCWFIGFYVIFMLMYVLGFMGMICCLQSIVNLVYELLLLVVVCGVFIVGVGILCQIIQVVVLICDCKKIVDLIGDLWDVCMLEWEIFLLLVFYNFVILLDVIELDDFWECKQCGEVWLKLVKYIDIYMLCNIGMGVVIGVFSLVFGFVMIWYIWWLVIVGFVGMIVMFIYCIFDQDVDYWVLVVEVECIENVYCKYLEVQGLVKLELKV